MEELVASHRRPYQPASDGFMKLGKDDIFPVWVSGLPEAISHARARMKQTQQHTVIVQSVADDLPDQDTLRELSSYGIPFVSVSETHTRSPHVDAELLDDTARALEDRALGLRTIRSIKPPALDDDAYPRSVETFKREMTTDEVSSEERQKFLVDFYANASCDDGAR